MRRQTKKGKKYRSRSEIIVSILESALDGNSKTKIMFHAYLSFAQMKEYLSFVLDNGLIEYDAKNMNYITTAKGQDFLRKTRQLNREI